MTSKCKYNGAIHANKVREVQRSLMPNAAQQRIDALERRIRAAEQQFGRPAGSVRLVAVSKRHPAGAIRAVVAAGVANIGENFVQEALAKQAQLADLAIVWHFIGRIQSNKTGELAEHFDWVHSVDRAKVATRLAGQRAADRAPLEVCIQVNVDDEAAKGGVSLGGLEALALEIAELPGLRLRGLMAIPRPVAGFQGQRAAFAAVRRARDDLNARHSLGLDTLSMGMSGDLEAAIAEGATLVRVGTAVFGPRDRGGGAA